MVLTEENYFSKQADNEYMSVSQFKDFVGTYGRIGCEFAAIEKLTGRYYEEPSIAMLVGSYVDEYFSGGLDRFKAENPQIFRKDGGLKSDFVKAEHIIHRLEQDEYFMKMLSGEKQTIMTAELFGVPWKIKMDSYLPGIGIVDLKVMQSIRKLEWVKDTGYLDFVRYWNYDVQGAVYQKVVEINTGKKLPFYIAAVSKEEEPDIQVIHVTQNFLDDAISIVEANLPRVLRVKNGEAPPDRCERCSCCRKTKVLKKPISLLDLMHDV